MKKFLVHNLVCVWVIVLTPFVAESQQRKASFVGIGDLNGGAFASRAQAISADGKTVVGTGTSDRGKEGVRWSSANGLKSIGDLPGGEFESHANAVSKDGRTIVGWSDGKKGEEAFRWTEKRGIEPLGDLGGSFLQPLSRAIGVSRDGRTVVGLASATRKGRNGKPYSRHVGFYWTKKDGMEGLGPAHPFDSWSAVAAVSNDSKVFVGYSQPSDQSASRACVWHGPKKPKLMPQFQNTIGVYSQSVCNAISTDGSVLAGENCGEAFLLVGPNFKGSKDSPTPDIYAIGRLRNRQPTAAHGFSDDASIVVGSSGNSEASNEAFIWDQKNSIRPLASVLQESGAEIGKWRLLVATGISADGTTIVGNGINPLGKPEGWIAHLPR